MGNGGSGPAGAVTLDDIMARARALVPALRERARHTEQLRRIPPETLREFRESGIYRMLQLARYGGLELAFGDHTEMSVELARGCASSAWDACITACHGWVVGMLPPEAQDEIWGDDPTVEVSTSFRPVELQVKQVDGGLRIGGRWKFSSGVDHCAWVLLTMTAELEAGDGAPQMVFGLVPLAECRIEDTWFATGLAGTGSNDIVVDDHFIPRHRILGSMEIRGGASPGSAVNPGYLYRLPMLALFAFNLVGVAIGAARGALELVTAELSGRTSITQAKLAEQQSVQLRIAESMAEIDAAHALTVKNIQEINRQGRQGELPDMEQRTRYRRDNAFAAMLCVRAVDRVQPLLGGAGLAAGDPVNRAWRDVHAVSRHIGLTWDVQGPLHGAISLGLPCPDPRL